MPWISDSAADAASSLLGADRYAEWRCRRMQRQERVVRKARCSGYSVERE